MVLIIIKLQQYQLLL